MICSPCQEAADAVASVEYKEALHGQCINIVDGNGQVRRIPIQQCGCQHRVSRKNPHSSTPKQRAASPES